MSTDTQQAPPKPVQKLIANYPTGDSMTIIGRRPADGTNTARYAQITQGKFGVVIEEAQLRFILKELEKL